MPKTDPPSEKRPLLSGHGSLNNRSSSTAGGQYAGGSMPSSLDHTASRTGSRTITRGGSGDSSNRDDPNGNVVDVDSGNMVNSPMFSTMPHYGSENIGYLPSKDSQSLGYRLSRRFSKPGSKFFRFVGDVSSSMGLVAIVYAIYVAANSLSKIFLKRVNDRMQNYSVIYTNLIWVFWLNVVTLLLTVPYIWYKRVYQNNPEYRYWHWLNPFSRLASTCGRFSQLTVAAFAFWDQLNSTMMTVPAPYLSIPSLNILQNFQLIFVLIVSFLWLGMRYEQAHYAGCILIVLAGLATVIVEIQSGAGFTYKDSQGISHPTSPLWYFVYIMGTLPLAIGNCLKQKCLKDVDLDVMWASVWNCLWQMVWGVIFFPLNWLPYPDPAPRYYPQDTFTLIKNGIMCFSGIAPSDSAADANCAAAGGSAAFWFSMYIFLNAFTGILLLVLTKWMSATWVTVGGVLCQNLASVLSMSPLLMGASAARLTAEQWLGLALSAVAMWVYNLANEHDKEGHDVKGTHVAALPDRHVYEVVPDDE